MNTRNPANRARLYGEIINEIETFRSMIKHRMQTGSSYRFEFTFEMSHFCSESQLLIGVGFMMDTLRQFTENNLIQKLSVVEPSIFPQSMLLINDWLWKSICPVIDTILREQLHSGLKYSSRELVAFIERLMIVSINGNVDRNLQGTTPKALRVVEHLENFNWPYLESRLINKIEWGIFFNTDDIGLLAPDPRSLLLFSFLPRKYKSLCNQNVKTLVDLEHLLIRLDDEDEQVENEEIVTFAVTIFKDVIKNFINEVGTFCCEKLMDKSQRSGSSALMKRSCSRLDALSKESFFPSIEQFLVEREISVIHGSNISVEDLWNLHVMQGLFSKMQSTPDWFCAHSTLVAFRVQLEEWSTEEAFCQVSRQALYQAIICKCKG